MDHPFSRIDIGLVAGDYEGVDHGSSICGVVIVAVAIVVQADLQWAYDLLDIVVVRPEAAIVYVSCQLGHVREGIVHCLCHWGFLRIYPYLGIKPGHEVLDYRIRLLLSFLLALFNAEAGNIGIVLNGVQPADGCNGGLRRRFVLHQAGDEVSSAMIQQPR